MTANLSGQMVQVLLLSVRFALAKKKAFTAVDAHGYEVDLDDAKSFLEELKLNES